MTHDDDQQRPPTWDDETKYDNPVAEDPREVSIHDKDHPADFPDERTRYDNPVAEESQKRQDGSDEGAQSKVLLVRAGAQGVLVGDFVRAGMVAVAWSRFGDLSAVDSASQLKGLLRSAYSDEVKPEGHLPDKHQQLVWFLHGVQTGGWVVTVDSSRKLLLVGRLAGGYRFLPGSKMFSGKEFYRHARPVNWEFVVNKDELSQDSNTNLVGGQKTAHFLNESTVEDILTAPRMSLAEYLKDNCKLEFVEAEDDVRESLWTFNEFASDYENRARRLVRDTEYWVHDPVRDLFGPAKFVGYKQMGFPFYEAAHNGIVEGAPFDGYRTPFRRVRLQPTRDESGDHP